MEIVLTISCILNVILGGLVAYMSLPGDKPSKPQPSIPRTVPFEQLSFKAGNSIPNKFGMQFEIESVGPAGVVMKDADWKWDTGALIFRKKNTSQALSWHNFVKAFPQYEAEIQSFSSPEFREEYLSGKEYERFLGESKQELRA